MIHNYNSNINDDALHTTSTYCSRGFAACSSWCRKTRNRWACCRCRVVLVAWSLSVCMTSTTRTCYSRSLLTERPCFTHSHQGGFCRLSRTRPHKQLAPSHTLRSCHGLASSPAPYNQYLLIKLGRGDNQLLMERRRLVE